MRAILISPNESQRLQFQAALGSCSQRLALSRVLDAYPTEASLARIIRAWAPDIVFLSMENPETAELLSQHINKEFVGIHQIAIHTSQEPEVFRKALRLRMRELLAPPFDTEFLHAMIERIAEEIEVNPVQIGTTDRFFAFLPAKSGVGTSTIAANLSWALTKTFENKVLLADFDLHSGVSGFLFNVEHEYSVTDAANRSKDLDEEAWQKLVKKVGKVDLLLSGAPRVTENIQQKQISNLIDFARRNYSVVNADLPDTLDDVTLTVLREANRIFLVTTPELASLRLARLKVLTLRQLDLEDKATLLVNRVSKNAELSLEEIERVVGLPVFASFGCEYADLVRSTREGRPSPKLAAGFAKFSEKLLEKKALSKPKKARFIERFAVVPMRYGFR